jgi:hypothetical protein
VSENVKMEPAARPGTASGRITRRSVVHPFAPRSAEASRYEYGSRSSAAYTGRTMNGNQMYVNTSHIAQFVYAMF